MVAAHRLQLCAARQLAPSRSAAASACSRAGRRTCGCRTSSATRASSSRESARGTLPRTAFRSWRTRRTSRRSSTGGDRHAFTNEIDLIDPDYKYPTLLRGNLAYDRELPWGLVGSGRSALHERHPGHQVPEPEPRAVPPVPVGMPVGGATTLDLDGRQILNRLNNSFSDVIFLTNSGEGYSWSTMFEVRRPFRNGWFAQGSYLYGVSKSIMDGTSSQAASNWGNVLVPDDPSNPPLATSSYDPGHRINLSASYEIPVIKGVHDDGVDVLLRPVGPAVHAAVLRRRQRRRPHGFQRPAVHPGVGERGDVHGRHVSGPAELRAGGRVSGAVRRQDRFRATPAARRGRTSSTSA